MTKRTLINTPDAPQPIGAYSHAVRYQDTLYCSGAIPIDPADGTVVEDSRRAETTRCLRNLDAVCRAEGTELRHALRLTVYTTHLECFAEINEAFSEFFGDSPPARAAVGVAALPKGVAVEIDAIVAVE